MSVHHDEQTFVIVGAGQAGAWIAKTLRSEGFGGRIVLVGDERHAPYERPPLSKGFLVDGPTAEATILGVWEAEAAGIEMRLSTSVVSIDRPSSTLACDDGETLRYDRLFLATGGSVRVPPAAQSIVSDRLHVLRTRDDAERFAEAVRGARHVLIIGGGWIGLETAASCRSLGIDVTIVEAGDRLCARSLPPTVSTYLRQLHEDHGIRFVFDARCEAIEPSDDAIAIVLADGRRIEADHVVIGVGIAPNTGLAETAGLAVDDGIVVDEMGATSDSAIYAVGDVARHPSRFGKGLLRLESWANAQNQAIAVAKGILGGGPYHEVPWFWSDQYEINLQVLGLPDRGSTVFARGTPAAGKGLWLVVDDAGVLAGIVAVNAGGDLRGLRKLVAEGGTPDAAQWRDVSMPTRKIVDRTKTTDVFA